MGIRISIVVAVLTVVGIVAAGCSESDSAAPTTTTWPTSSTTAAKSTTSQIDSTPPPAAPTVRGVFADAGAAGAFLLEEASVPTYDGMTLVINDNVLVDPEPGSGLSELTVGMTVDVWLADACRASLPPQCDVVAIQVVER